MEPRHAQNKGLNSKAGHSGSLSRSVTFESLCVWCVEQRFLSGCCSVLTVVREGMRKRERGGTLFTAQGAA